MANSILCANSAIAEFCSSRVNGFEILPRSDLDYLWNDTLTAEFVSDLNRNPVDRFSRDASQMICISFQIQW